MQAPRLGGRNTGDLFEQGYNIADLEVPNHHFAKQDKHDDRHGSVSHPTPERLLRITYLDRTPYTANMSEAKNARPDFQ